VDELPDHYAALGVSVTASALEISSAFKRGMRECHPDLHPGDVLKEAHAKELTAAKAVLLDPLQRQAYDLKRSAPVSAPEARAPRPKRRKASVPKPFAARKAPPRPPKKQRTIIEIWGRTWTTSMAWQSAVKRIYREATSAANPGRTVRIVFVQCIRQGPHDFVFRFAYIRGQRRVPLRPVSVRAYLEP
jgi:curved DNA-binding protein CbpA